jgi:hypothetical protein
MKKKAVEKSILVPIKIPPKDLKALKALARKYANGNFSAWLRHAGARYRPKVGELIYTPAVTKKKG